MNSLENTMNLNSLCHFFSFNLFSCFGKISNLTSTAFGEDAMNVSIPILVGA